MTTYQTTREIKSLASGGVNLRARQPVTPGAFTPQLWQALLNEGAIVEVVRTAVKPLGNMTLDELKALADDKGVPYTWNIKPETLIERLQNA